MTQGNRKTRGIRRGVAMAVVGATALGGAPLLAGAQTGPDALPDPVDAAPFCANVPEGYQPFADAGVSFPREIACLYAAQITNGTGDGTTYSPGQSVRREHMASFVARMIDTANALDADDVLADLPEAADDAAPFNDVVPGSTHADNINRLEAAGIVVGGAGGRPATQFAPSLFMTRGQMASAIVRAVEFMTEEELVADGDYFTDDTGDTHEGNINVLAEAGVARGTTGTRYEPGRNVNRGQMSALLIRALAVFEQGGAIIALPFLDAEASGATSTDNTNGTATIEMTVENANGDPVTGLTTADISYEIGGARYTLASGPLAGLWSGFDEPTPGNYSVVFTAPPPGFGTFPASDIMVRGVIIEAELTVVVTNTPM